jgi:antitoxin VapB
MTTARVFKSGNSQAVRLPKEFRVASTAVEIYRRGDEIVLRELRATPADAFRLLASLPDDFMAGGRDDLPPQERDLL